MLLIHKINYTDFSNYKEDYINCLNHNSDNHHISKIFVFIERHSKELPINDKTYYFIKKNISNSQIFELARRNTTEKRFIFIDQSALGLQDDIQFLKDNTIYNSSYITVLNSSTKIDENFNILEESKQLNINTINYREVENIKRKHFDNKPVKKIGEIIKTNVEKKLDVIIVSVNYNDFLILTLFHNTKIFENITVVTSSEDTICQNICKKFKVNCIITDVMFEKEAKFNKGKAINKGIQSLVDPSYILLLDADIIVKEKIDLDVLENDFIYTSDRYICNDYESYKNIIVDFDTKKSDYQEIDKGLGFFQLFNYKQENQFPENSDDAAQSDLTFRNRFTNRKSIDNTVIHLGTPYKNWSGRKTEKFISDVLLKDLLRKLKNSNKIEFKTLYDILEYLPYETKTIEFITNNLSDDEEPYIIHVTSKYHTTNEDTLRRNSFAESTWKTIYENHKMIPLYIYQKDDSLPKVKEFFEAGYKLCEKDNDIILYTNSDICLTEDSYDEIVKYCNLWQCTFSFRKDFFHKLNSPESKEDIEKALYSGGIKTPHGADLFAVTKKWWAENKDLIPDGQVIGRPTWDWIFRIAMGISIKGNNTLLEPFEKQGMICESPNINYHERHDSYWEQKENLLDKESINNVRIAYKWMSDKSPNKEFFTGKEYFIKTYGQSIIK